MAGDPVAARERLRLPLGLTGITMLVGGVGALVDTYRFTAEVESAGGATLSAVMAWLGGTAMLLSVTLGLALAGALGWFLLLNATVGVASDVATEPWGGPDSGPTPSHFHQEIHP